MRKQAKSLQTLIKMKIKTFILLIFVLLGYSVFAQQTDCSIKLQEAENLYESGIIDSIPTMLRPCVDGGFDNEELARAYKLLILTYLFEDYQEMAEFTMLKFLDKFPEYEIKATDPVEFTYLYESYKTIPAFSIGIIGGVNYSIIRIIEPYNMSNTEKYKGGYSSGVTWQAGLQFKRYINENIDINLDVILTNKTFENNFDQLDSKIEYKESQSMLSFPLSGTYDFLLGKFSPYVRLGANLDYILTAEADISRYIDPQAGVDDVTGPAIDIKDDRNPINISAMLGGGVKYYVKKGYLMLDVRYYLGLTNNVNSDSRSIYGEKRSKYNYEDDDFAVNNLFISVGYVFPFYKTKSKKK